MFCTLRTDAKLEMFLHKNILVEKCNLNEDISYTETKFSGVVIYSS